ncbi:MAG TPA: hypothetical protein VKT73_15455 [Xanthobacteraceae bacterium]|nr:hypothetical protein [Xanthobacteraceae bacterium]
MKQGPFVEVNSEKPWRNEQFDVAVFLNKHSPPFSFYHIRQAVKSHLTLSMPWRYQGFIRRGPFGRFLQCAYLFFHRPGLIITFGTEFDYIERFSRRMCIPCRRYIWWID